MDFKDILKSCHLRHENPLKQRKGMPTHCLYNMHNTHQIAIYCAHKYPVMLSDLERANICFMPVGRATRHGQKHGAFYGKQRLSLPGRTKNEKLRDLNASWGIRIYTGIPSEFNGARWHDLEFTYQALCAEPDTVIACIEAMVNVVANPLLTISKSGGLRFSCRVKNYLHSDSEEARSYICGGTSTDDDSSHRDVYLDILGENGLSCWDARYEILMGDLLNPPIIEKEVLFAHADTLRTLIHEPTSQRKQQPATAVLPNFGSHNLELAKAAFIKRGFSYVCSEDGLHHWIKYNTPVSDTPVSLWESNDTVWIWAFNPNRIDRFMDDSGLPVEATPITEIWKDTGIPPSNPAGMLPISDKVIALRKGQLSPLGIKRDKPILQEHGHTTKVYESPEKNIDLVRHTFDSTTHITKLIGGTRTTHDDGIDSYLLDGGAICLNTSSIELAEAESQRFENQNLPSHALWKPRSYKWEQVKDIPVDVRMTNPFQGGNVCEDPERCIALEKKGGDPQASICPQCPVYTECQQYGYLSQYRTFNQMKAQIIPSKKLFLNPQYAGLLDKIIGDDTDRLYIMHVRQLSNMSIECNISKDMLKSWSDTWHGNALRNLSRALQTILENKDLKKDNIVKRLRSTVKLFQHQKKELIEQMCQVNVQGRVVERGIVDSETEEELARYTIQFEGGASAYIPLNEKAANRIKTNGLPSFHLNFFQNNSDVNIPMQMTQAIELGIFDISTLEKIQALPNVSPDPDWTILHQLQRFFAHYKRDADAPITVTRHALRFWIPPVLHPKVERLLIMSSSLSQQYYHNLFPEEKTEVVHVKPATWQTQNQVFQIRTGNYHLQTLVEYDNNWNKSWLSNTGMRFFLGIREEIERNPNIKHAIITYNTLAKWMREFANKENVTCITDFKKIYRFQTELEQAQVVWLIGTPFLSPGFMWLRSQMLFGNEDKPICYEVDPETYVYNDERVQELYNQHIVALLTDIVGRTGLNHFTGKTVVIMTSIELPDITDRSETTLFDWEDFEVAGGLEKLPEVIATRQRFEKERENITAEFSREEVERILGCSTRQANRVLQRLRGGTPLRVPLKEQILSAISTGDKSTAELVERVEGHPISIKQELKRLVDTNEIVRVRRGIYTLLEPE